jgi:hypothetical protein
MKEKPHLEEFASEQLISELRYRASEGRSERSLSSLLPTPGLAAFSNESLFELLFSHQFSVYGVDDRRDIFAINDKDVLKAADGVVAVFDALLVTPNGDGTSRIFTATYGEANNLCPGEPFINQPATICATGFLVAPNMILTAGHVVNPSNLPGKLFVFGFKLRGATSPQVFDIPDHQIYRGKEVIGWNDDDAGDDFALIVLERVVKDHAPLPIRREGQVAQDQPVYVLGHPKGLPLKFADGAQVTRNTDECFFVANLDTYTGNSGSPILSSAHIVEGILVRGERDFVPVGNCWRSLVCPGVRGQSDCAGEECMRIRRVAHLIPM